MQLFPNHKVFLHKAADDSVVKAYTVCTHEISDILSQAHSTMVAVEWRYGEDLPNAEVSLLLQILDKTLLPIAVSGAHIPVHTTLGDGFREICFYTTDYDQFMEDLNQCLDPLPRLPIGIEYDSDPEWVYALRLREIAIDGGGDSCVNVQLAA